ncbi:MAG: sensor histidine kinase, partial [Acidobacteriota bacterium]|nr:sensor histidine kinase [Acidobacteriota bacterium]
MVDAVVFAPTVPDYVEPKVDQLSAWPELVEAMKTGEPQTMERYAPDRTPMISAAVPLAGGGGLTVMRNARDVTRTVRAER